MIRESEIVQDWIQEGIQQGVQQGIQQGVQQGVQQGIQQGVLRTAREVLIETLETRFEIIPRSLMDIINGIDDPTLLKMLHKKALTAASLDKFKEIMEAMLK